MRRAHQPHCFRITRRDAGEHDETEAAGAQQFVRGAHTVHRRFGTHEQRTVSPERARDSARAIDPRGAIAGSDGGFARRTQHGGDAAGRLAHREHREWKPAVRKRAIERRDAGRDRSRGAMDNGCRTREPLFDERAKRSN